MSNPHKRVRGPGDIRNRGSKAKRRRFDRPTSGRVVKNTRPPTQNITPPRTGERPVFECEKAETSDLVVAVLFPEEETEDEKDARLLYERCCRVEPAMVPARALCYTTDGVNNAMRAIVAEWLSDIASKGAGLQLETLCLAMSLLDRVAVLIPTSKKSFQLLGSACMWIAYKYQENRHQLDTQLNMVWLSDGTFTQQELIQMEACILNAIGFRLSLPSRLYFLDWFHRHLFPQGKTSLPLVESFNEQLAVCALRFSLLRGELSLHKPSVVAALCMWATLVCTNLTGAELTTLLRIQTLSGHQALAEITTTCLCLWTDRYVTATSVVFEDVRLVQLLVQDMYRIRRGRCDASVALSTAGVLSRLRTQDILTINS
jgi:hypothetical protein